MLEVGLGCGFVNVVGCWGFIYLFIFLFFKGGVGGCGFVSVVVVSVVATVVVVLLLLMMIGRS